MYQYNLHLYTLYMYVVGMIKGDLEKIYEGWVAKWLANNLDCQLSADYYIYRRQVLHVCKIHDLHKKPCC